MRSRIPLVPAAGSVVLALALGGCSRGYAGPGTHHPFVGRHTSEIVYLPNEANPSNGRLDGKVVRIVSRLDSDEPKFVTADCMGGRVNLVVDGDVIVAATEDDCD